MVCVCVCVLLALTSVPAVCLRDRAGLVTYGDDVIMSTLVTLSSMRHHDQQVSRYHHRCDFSFLFTRGVAQSHQCTTVTYNLLVTNPLAVCAATFSNIIVPLGCAPAEMYTSLNVCPRFTFFFCFLLMLCCPASPCGFFATREESCGWFSSWFLGYVFF